MTDPRVAPAQTPVPPAPGDPAPRASTRPSAGTRLWRALGPRRLSAVYLGIFFMVLFTLLNPGTFLTSTTTNVVFNSGSVTCLLALAFLVPLATESYDLSIGSMMTFGLTIVIYLFNSSGLPLWLISVIAVVACALVGAVNGFIIVRLNVDSFIATLGVSQVLLAASLLISGNKQLVGNFPELWTKLGNENISGIPYPLLYVLAVAVVLWYVLEHMSLGRYLFAIGGNEEAARLSGVPTKRLIWGSMVASGAIAGFAGVIYAMRTGTSTPTVGSGLLFPAVAAVFLGASQLSQRPNVWGTLIAYFALAFGIQGLTLSLGTDAAWASPLFQGLSLIVAVSIASRPVIAKLRSRAEEPE